MKKVNILKAMLIISIASLLSAEPSLLNPTEVVLNNSTEQSITIHTNADSSVIIEPGEAKKIELDAFYDFFVLRQMNNLYRIQFQDNLHSLQENFNAQYLDAGTIIWLANCQSKKTFALDQINIRNDLLYKIAVLWKINQMRSRAQLASPDETISRVVRQEHSIKSNNNSGQLLLAVFDANAKKYSIPFMQRVITPELAQIDNSWHEITLSANTLIAFNNGCYKIL